MIHRVITEFNWLRSFQNNADLFLPGFNQSRKYRQILLQIPESTFRENPTGESRADPSGNIGGRTDGLTDMARIIITTDCANSQDACLIR